MSSINISEFIAKIESEYDEVQPGVLTSDSHFKELIHWNSMNSLVMIVMIEYEYGVLINETEMKAVHTIQQLAQLINSKRKQ